VEKFCVLTFDKSKNLLSQPDAPGVYAQHTNVEHTHTQRHTTHVIN